MRDNCILDLDSPSYPPRLEEYKQCGCSNCVDFLIKERITRLERLGYLDPNCKSCQAIFYPAYRAGDVSVFAPSHKPSDRCQSGKRPHCTCDVCF